jgi:tetratricopeptide (TPR) repeat protein
MKLAARIAIALILAAALIVPSPLALACGPYFPNAIFTATTGPDELVSYTSGNLQLLQPTYWHRPLFIAYRNLIGKPFTPAELKVLATNSNSEIQSSEVQSADAKPAPSPEQEWVAARDKILATGSYGSDSSNHFQRGDAYVFYMNCLDDAYRNAISTLDKRVAQFGAQSQAVRGWITAQGQVFENCSNDSFTSKSKPAVIPAAAPDSDPEVIRADRAYQIAAAHFYAGDYDAALSEFNAIAKDSDSPYANMAPYLTARTLIRKGTLGNVTTEPEPHSLEQAETKLRSILADKNLAEIHPASQRLLGYLAIRLHPAERFHELESLLTGSATVNTPSAGFDQDLTDYLWMLDHDNLVSNAPAPPRSTPPSTQLSTSDSKSPAVDPGDMTDWIRTFQSPSKPAFEHSLQRWRESKSQAWLVAAISKADAGDTAVPELIAAAGKIRQDSPASITATFHRLRLITESGKSADARNQLDQVLAQTKPELGRSAKNQFLALRSKLATNLDEYLRYAPRNATVALAIAGESDSAPDISERPDAATKPSLFFDADSAIPLTEKMPLRLLVDAAKSKSLPASLRREIVVAAWTRAILLGKESVGRELTPLLVDLAPELKDSLAPHDAAHDSTEQRFAAVFAILHNPGVRPFIPVGLPRDALSFGKPTSLNEIDKFRDNWWCSPAPPKPEQGSGGDYFRMFANVGGPLRQIYSDGKIPAPAFLTEADRAEAEKEIAVLASQPAAPNWLGKQVLDFARTHPDDPRIPEALHLVVRASRYGCSDGDSSESFSKAAFTLLHSKYPDNPWTNKTPYWYQ